MSGHVCPRLIYLEAADYVKENTAADGLGDLPTPVAAEVAPAPAPATALVVSLHALAGIRDERTMLLPVMIHGERLVALLDMGSTHNFLPKATMRRLALQPTGGEQLRVTVANGDRLCCHGLAAWRGTCPSPSATGTSPSRATASTWAASTSSSASTS
ncbi:uncharacterized protein LOC125516618 [Triticum urartu]|uniref:uncharacterized protein LOC125516618 n=1 Tax=Triticum urartu TaxID=4572 RepID=UPI0020439729|nr:uncharacterized protein LOC125516618 [Triticum urartu]